MRSKKLKTEKVREYSIINVSKTPMTCVRPFGENNEVSNSKRILKTLLMCISGCSSTKESTLKHIASSHLIKSVKYKKYV